MDLWNSNVSMLSDQLYNGVEGCQKVPLVGSLMRSSENTKNSCVWVWYGFHINDAYQLEELENIMGAIWEQIGTLYVRWFQCARNLAKWMNANLHQRGWAHHDYVEY